VPNHAHIANCRRLMKDMPEHSIQGAITPIMIREGGGAEDRLCTVGLIVLMVAVLLIIRSEVAGRSGARWYNETHGNRSLLIGPKLRCQP
jgi:hypothetical protein